MKSPLPHFLHFPVRIEILNTGTELMLGQVVNSHGAWFGRELFKLGLRAQRQTCVPDGDPIRQAMLEALPRCDVLLVTGGLGPTTDDLTREIVAELLGLPLHFDPAVMRHIDAIFAQHGRTTPPGNERQAMVPQGALVLDNPNGTAPGLLLPALPALGTPHVFLLPGPPRELYPMFTDSVAPRLREWLGEGAVPGFINFRIINVGESSVAQRIEIPLEPLAQAGLEIGYCARPGEVDVRLIGDPEQVAAGSEIVRQAFPTEIATESEDELHEVVVSRLIQLGHTLATAESCTGGLIASSITDVPGASGVFLRGYVTYSNEAKSELLGVPESLLAEHGAVSEPVARAMAEGSLRAARSTHALAVTGIAGPGGGTEEKPVGTVFIGLASQGHETKVLRFRHPGDRATFKQRTLRTALDLLRKRLAGLA